MDEQLGADSNKTSFKWNDNWWENIYDGSLKNVKTVEKPIREESTTSSSEEEQEEVIEKSKKIKKSKGKKAKKANKKTKNSKIKRVVISDTDSSDESE